MDSLKKKKGGKYIQIKNILKKFQVQVLAKIIPEYFKKITWNMVKREIKNANLQLCVNDIVEIAMQLIQSEDLDSSVLDDIYVKLKLFDRSSRNVSVWTGVKLLNKVEEIQFGDCRSLEKNIIRAYRTQALNADCYIRDYRNIIWIATVEKKITKKGVRNCSPCFFALRADLFVPCIFYYPKYISNTHSMSLLVKGLGYEDSKAISLDGKDLDSLFNMINKKYDPNLKHEVPDFHPVTVVEDDLVVDYTQGKEREKYANKILPGHTKLYSYTVETENNWRGTTYIPEMAEEEEEEDEPRVVKMSMTVTSSDPNITVEDIFKEMISSGMVRFPVPNYIANLPVSAKNRSRIRKRKLNTTAD